MVHVIKPWSSGRDSDFDDLDEDFVDFDEFDVPLERHIIVSGDDALATTIVEQLFNSGASVVKLAAADLADAGVAAELADAEVGSALAVVCAGEDDATNSKSRCWQGKPTRMCAWWCDSTTTWYEERWPSTTGPARSST